MSSPPSLTKGSLVWAKLPAFPWWPAQVTDVTGSDVHVTFCGTGDLGTASRADVVPYGSRLSLRETKQKERWKKKFKHAVGEADAIHAGPVEGAAPDAGDTTTSHDEAGAVQGKVAEEEETVVLDEKVGSKAAAEDSSEDEGAGPSKGAKKSKGSSNKRKLPADPGLPGWCAPPVENAPLARLAVMRHTQREPSSSGACGPVTVDCRASHRSMIGPPRCVFSQADHGAPERERPQVEDLPRPERRGDQIARDSPQ